MTKASSGGAKAKSPASPVKRRSIPLPPEVADVTINDNFSSQVTVIPRTTANLILGSGTTESPAGDRSVLLPYVEVRFLGDEIAKLSERPETPEAELRPLFTATLPLENAGFILLDMMADLKRICAAIGTMGTSGLSVEPTRMAHMRYFVAHLERQAVFCRRRLDDAYGIPEDETTEGSEEPADRVRKKSRANSPGASNE